MGERIARQEYLEYHESEYELRAGQREKPFWHDCPEWQEGKCPGCEVVDDCP